MEARLRRFAPGDFGRLVEMYAGFEPKGEFQGLPPRSVPEIELWLRRLCEKQFEQFVIEVAGRIVGHAMLCRFPRGDEAEFAIFVHQDFRGLGLGKRLMLGALHYGCKVMELSRVWLVVQGSNPRALRLFESAGFRATEGGDPLRWELQMVRASHCAECLQQRCVLFGQGLPVTVPVRVRRQKGCVGVD
jgi:RimJ/RimL family protein N-acetyltransferase